MNTEKMSEGTTGETPAMSGSADERPRPVGDGLAPDGTPLATDLALPTSADPLPSAGETSETDPDAPKAPAVRRRMSAPRVRKAGSRSAPVAGEAQMTLPSATLIPAAESHLPERAYLLTNRGNLLHILSAGLITPMAGYTKYYPDPGELCPGAVLLFLLPPSKDLIAATVPERPGQFPVLVEIDLTGLHGPIRVLTREMQVREVATPPFPEALAILIPGAIPPGNITAIHFGSPTDRREFSHSLYSNLREVRLPMHVSAHLFGGPDIDVTGFTAAVRTYGPLFDSQPSTWRKADSLAGAPLLLAALVERDLRQKMRPLAKALNILAGDGGPDTASEATDGDVTVERLVGSLPGFLITTREDSSSAADRLTQFLPSAQVAPALGEAAGEALVFLAAADHLATLTPHEHTASETLEAVRHSIEECLAALGPAAAQGIRFRVSSHLDMVDAVVSQTMDIADYPLWDSPVAAGLLRFLLQPDPERALDLEADLLAPSPVAVAVSALLCGLLHGRSRIPVGCRPSREAEALIDAAVACRLNRTLGAPDWFAGTGVPPVKLHAGDGGTDETLTAGGVILLRRVRPACPPESSLQAVERTPVAEAAPAEPVVVGRPRNPAPPESAVTPSEETALPKASRETKAEVRTSLRRRLHASDLSDARQRDAAIALCRDAGWNDCLTTVLPLEGRTFLLTNYEGKLQLRVRGAWLETVSVEVRLIDFRRHLDSADWDVVPPEIMGRIGGMLGEE